MTRTAEARFWQAIGALTALAGGILLAFVFEKYGLASIEPRALAMGLAASFILLAAAACYVAGRALHVAETRLTSLEGFLWKVLAAVGMIAGAVVVVGAWRQQQALELDRLTMALAGAFSIMFGVICLVGQRVMSRMHDALTAERGESRAAGA